jgi:hypothetical protein
MFELVRDLWAFLSERRKLWLLPLLVALLVVGGLIMLAETSAVAPLVYTLF